MQTYIDPNQFLLNSEGTSVALMNYFDTSTENDGISPTGATNIPGQNPTTVQPVAKAYAAQSQPRPQETQKVDDNTVSKEYLEQRLTKFATDIKQDMVTKEYIDQNFVTREYMEKNFVTREYMEKNFVTREYMEKAKKHIDDNLVTKTFLKEQMDKQMEGIKQLITKQNPTQ